ncbi:MAG: ribulose-phosphate 3-epimerase [Candidatus Marinimicrobia bacterium]|nr:ribulose-phosphate 3-epimerase [Candidatus Neomarinimicrobiota bacterium]
MIDFSSSKKYLAPSLLSADFSRLHEEIKTVEAAGADCLHLDIMDGHFVPNLTFGPPLIKRIRKITTLPLDVHLMITNAEASYKQYIDAGADMISVHVEAVTHMHRLISAIKTEGIKAGVVLNPATPLTMLDEILSEVDYVLLMSVNPGFGGQSFIRSSIEKIKKLKARIHEQQNKNILIELDGGVNKDNLSELSQAGVDIFVAGSAVFKSKNIAQTMTTMKNILNQKIRG